MHSQEARRKVGSCSGLRLSQGSIPAQSASGLQVPAKGEAGGQAASPGAVGIGAERSSLQLGITGPQHLSLLRGLTTAHPFPQASQVSAPGGQGAWRACARGHHQHRISFHLCKDSLTPEHINILNDSERNWDSRRPAPPFPSCPSPPRTAFPATYLAPPGPPGYGHLALSGPGHSLLRTFILSPDLVSARLHFWVFPPPIGCKSAAPSCRTCAVCLGQGGGLA